MFNIIIVKSGYVSPRWFSLYPPYTPLFHSLLPPHSGVEGGIGVKGDWERAQTLIRLSMESLGG
ncbi:TPA: hypothetical protein ACH3X2_003213 [Trebouxia sp. C0005]